ncbi:unnamed protein product (mitochondrion) [Plasmodiophora brassicae]|uniref:RING-type E3 ubiquitin transferase BRCA1 n=1 Tax=Plasmodiophora brassicae TaxID=37360 RepID=A0A0G4J1J0_PLABS|nr:hypothetical protein PBRA_001988 [Plasmodiophora brassicae]SPR01404.1 unnamed protein product [Plasmodiophora brassicae]
MASAAAAAAAGSIVDRLVARLRPDLSCSSCHSLPAESYSLVTCDHAVCRACRDDLLDRLPLTCPVCGVHVWRDRIRPCVPVSNVARHLAALLEEHRTRQGADDEAERTSRRHEQRQHRPSLDEADRPPADDDDDIVVQWSDASPGPSQNDAGTSEGQSVVEVVPETQEFASGHARPDSAWPSPSPGASNRKAAVSVDSLERHQERLSASFDVMGISGGLSATSGNPVVLAAGSVPEPAPVRGAAAVPSDDEPRPPAPNVHRPRPVRYQFSGIQKAGPLAVHCKSLGGISARSDSDMTHLICFVDERRLAKRTLKYMHAVARGIWVVSSHWVAESAAAGRWLDEEPFEVQGDSSTPDATGAPRQSRFCLARVFAGMRFVLDKDDPKVPDLAELIAFAGGAVVPRGEAAFCMICAHDLALSRAQKIVLDYNTIPVSLAWVFDSVSRYTVCDTRPYRLDLDQ